MKYQRDRTIFLYNFSRSLKTRAETLSKLLSCKPRPNDRNMPTQHVAPNNVAICCVGMLRSFGRGLKLMHDLPLNACVK